MLESICIFFSKFEEEVDVAWWVGGQGFEEIITGADNGSCSLARNSDHVLLHSNGTHLAGNMPDSAQWALLCGFGKFGNGEWDSSHLRWRDICDRQDDTPHIYDRTNTHAHCSRALANLTRNHGTQLSDHARSVLAFIDSRDRQVFRAQIQGDGAYIFDGHDDYRSDGETCGGTYGGICDDDHPHNPRLHT